LAKRGRGLGNVSHLGPHDLLNKQTTEALRHDKIRESIAFDFQHGYRMWTWFVNFWTKKSQKLILQNENQFNT